MKILVTGGAGFIGSNLCEKLLKDGNEVVAVDNLITGQFANVKPLLSNPNFTFLKQNITKPFHKKFEIRNSKFEIIFHLACPTGVPNLITLAREMLLTCSQGTINVMELALKNKANVVFTSSSEAYGDPKVSPQDETYTGNVDPTGIRSPYEEGKRFAESLISMYVRNYKINAKIVRVFNTYGPHMSPTDTRVIPAFLHQATKGEHLTIHGTGFQNRTFCHVDDLVEGLMIVMEKGKKGEVYNLGSDRQITIKDLAKLIIRITSAESELEFVKRPYHDHESRKPNLRKINKLGWKPKIGLEEGIEKTIRHFNLRAKHRKRLAQEVTSGKVLDRSRTINL